MYVIKSDGRFLAATETSDDAYTFIERFASACGLDESESWVSTYGILYKHFDDRFVPGKTTDITMEHVDFWTPDEAWPQPLGA